MKILIKNGRVWDGERFFFADVLTNEDKIEKIAPDINEQAEREFDASGMIVSAGLVDAHVHLLGISDPIYGVSHDLVSVPFGVTAVGDGGGVMGDKTAFQQNLVKAVTFVPIDIKNNQPDFSSLKERCNAYGEYVAGYKAYFDNGGGNVTDATPLAGIFERAEKDGKRVMVHCNGSPVPMSEYLHLFRAGDVLTHAFHGGEHTALEDDFKSLIEAQRRGVMIDGGFAGNVHLGFGVLRKALEKGIVPDVISSDAVKRSVYTRGGRYGLTECMSIACALGMKEEDIFRAVTANAADCVGKRGEWGELKEGGTADIAVLQFTRQPFSCTDKDGITLEYDNGYRCKMTVIGGEIVYVD